MTLIEIQNQIISKFVDNDIVAEEELKDTIKISKENEVYLPNLISAAFKNLENSGIVSQLNNKGIWILRQPLKSSGQSVDISMEVCNEIADVINSFLDAHQPQNKIRADKLNIAEAEIVMLLNIINELVSVDPQS